MWRLQRVLQGLRDTNHLPTGFSAKQGIRRLFPSRRGNIHISLLKNYYLYSANDVKTATGEIQATFDILADGSGRWLYRAVISSPDGAPASVHGRYGAGFVFSFSPDNAGHGYVETGDYDFINSGTYVGALAVTVEGFDPWIADHWPELFAQTSFIYLSAATGLDNLPDVSNAATDHGFAGLTMLQGAKVTLRDNSTGGGGPSGGGGSGFPGSIDWEIPPTDDDN